MKISVVIPIYGVERYIARCARSVLSQGYADKEIIFVDDATPDRSIAVLRDVLADYPRVSVRLLHHEVNRGLAAARKTGIEAATGEYIVSVDSDDYLAPDAIQRLAEEAKRTQADIVRMHCYFDWGVRRKIYRGAWVEDAQAYSRMLLSGQTMPNVWAHMIRSSLYKQTGLYPIEGLNNGEDYVLTPRLCWFANRIACVEEPLYFYTQTNQSSIVHTISENNIRNLTQAIETLASFYSDKSACAEALRAGQWLKKTDTMMRAPKRLYSVADKMPAALPVNMRTMTPQQRVAAHLIARRRWNILWCYSRCYEGLLEVIQILKGRRKKC